MKTQTPDSRSCAWWLACAAMLVLYALTVPRIWQCEGVDELEYLGLAHSLQRGEGYTLYGQPYVYYPPFYPALLSLVMRYDVTAWRLMYTLNALLGLTGIIVLSSWLRRQGGRTGRWAAWFSLFAYYPWSFSTRYLLAEPLYVFLSSLALLGAGQVFSENRAAPGAPARTALSALLSQMTKASSIALTAALTVAGMLSGFTMKRTRAWLTALAVVVLAGGFMIAWEIRAQHVAPHATESYTRWAKKILGISSEQQGMIARNPGEGTERPTPLPERTAIGAVKYGQYVLSMVRLTGNSIPLCGLLTVFFLSGLTRQWKQQLGSPLAWYTFISLVMICLTSWISSYLRYLYPLTPLLFYYLLTGARGWHRGLGSNHARWYGLALALCGAAGVCWTWRQGSEFGGSGAEQRYLALVSMACLGIYILLLAVGAWGFLRRTIRWPTRVPGGMLATILIIYAAHNGAIAYNRFNLTLQSSGPREKNLLGAVECGQWLKQNSAPADSCVSSFPRLVAFLSDRDVSSPAYEQNDRLNPGAADYILLTGEIKNIPDFRALDELRLREAAEKAEAEGAVKRAFSSGDAVIYKVYDEK